MNTEIWTTRKLLQWTTQKIEKVGIDMPRLRAEMLLCHVLKCERLKLYMDPDRPATEEERQLFRNLVKRALAHEPIDYLIGQAPFFGMTLAVSSATLIPRPATETIVRQTLETIADMPFESPVQLADIGTGSGAIAIAVAKQLNNRNTLYHMTASDISNGALDVAKQNAESQGTDIEWLEGSLLEPHTKTYDFILSNPPYIPDHEWDTVPKDVKAYEPTNALRGGVDGLDLIRPLITQACHHLNSNGWLMIETASCTTTALERLFDQAGFGDIQTLKDHENLARTVIGKWHSR